jgi:hypothetical protein
MNLQHTDLPDIFEALFGSRSVTPERTRFFNAMRAFGRVEESGWNGPRREADNGVDTLNVTQDYHVWLTDNENNGAIVDYPDHQIASSCPNRTENIVRQPWAGHLVEGIRPRLEREAPPLIRDLISAFGSVEAMTNAIMDNTFPVDHCTARAYFLYGSNPRRYNVVIGSLGFEQADGRIFWELG